MTDPKPLAGLTVCVTRAHADTREVIRQLEDFGARVVRVPSVRTHVIVPPHASAETALELGSRIAWLAFASPKGVDAWAYLLSRRGDELGSHTRLAAVGPATAQAITKAWRAPDVVAEAGTGEGLAASLMARAKPADGPVVLPATDAGRRVVVDALLKAGFEAHHVPVYRTIEGSLADGPVHLPARVHYVLFTSPSTVRGFLARATWPANATAVSIGPTTSQALREAGLEPHEAHTHTVQGIVDVLLARHPAA